MLIFINKLKILKIMSNYFKQGINHVYGNITMCRLLNLLCKYHFPNVVTHIPVVIIWGKQSVTTKKKGKINNMHFCNESYWY